MPQLAPILLASALGLAARSIAQQFPPPVTYDSVLKSPINPNITISYKEPEPGTCTTAFASQKQYTGYVNLPPFTLEPYQQDYPINTFFWFVEARHGADKAPLTIWLNGGPGASSMIGLFRESGPCEVVQLPDGSYGTQANPWGWDRASNLLFFDQPTQTGFSYDTPINKSVNLQDGLAYYKPQSIPPSSGIPPWSIVNATLASGNTNHTQNSTAIAARAAWHFLQGFLSAFPQYNPGQHPSGNTTEPTGINLFAESYGGQYGPAFADFFEDQNERRRTGELATESTLEIKLTSLGIVNGMVDTLIQAPTTPSFVFNNSYGIQAIDQISYLNLLSGYRAQGGCQETVTQCRDRIKGSDPDAGSFDPTTNAVCFNAENQCSLIINKAIGYSGRSPYDIRLGTTSSFPSPAYLEYLNNADVLRSIGAKVNYTEITDFMIDVYSQSFDLVRESLLPKLADLLGRGVRVALIYGDADVICNWVGGEAVSLALARLSSSYSTVFPAAGYADIMTNASYIGGQVRQYANLSFSRIYDAGHMVPAYQPETAFVVFSRIIQGDDISTGRDTDLSTFRTSGSGNSTHTNKAPPQPDTTCWIRAIPSTCTGEERTNIRAGAGVVKYGMWFAHEGDFRLSSTSTPNAGKPGHPATTSEISLTGVYTATATPKPSSGASRIQFRIPLKNRRATPPFEGKDRNFFYPYDEDDNAHRSSKARKFFIGAIAGLGGLLLLLLALTAGFLGWRYHRHRKCNRRFMGGPQETPPPILMQPQMKMAGVGPESKRPTESGKAEVPPLDSRTGRRQSKPMEPIPEGRPSAEKLLTSPPSKESLDPKHPSKLPTVPVPIPEKAEKSPRPSSTMLADIPGRPASLPPETMPSSPTLVNGLGPRSERGVSPDPSLLERVRTSLRPNKDPIPELDPPEEKVPTPPSRAVVLPPPARTPTASLPLFEINTNEGDKVPEVKINL